MPHSPKRICSRCHRGLYDPNTNECDVCGPRKSRSERRGPHRAQQKKWYDSARWKRAKAVFLRRPENICCHWCEERGIVTASQTIDHVKAPKGDPVLFWSPSNWVGSCLLCNAKRGAQGK